jgi:hypothetical protein
MRHPVQLYEPATMVLFLAAFVLCCATVIGCDPSGLLFLYRRLCRAEVPVGVHQALLPAIPRGRASRRRSAALADAIAGAVFKGSGKH